MIEHKYKVGDIVKVIDWGWGVDKRNLGKVVTIHSIEIRHSGDAGYTVTPTIDLKGEIIGEKSFELVKKGKVVKEKPEDLTRYMVYGTGCDNKGHLRITEKELKAEMKELINDGGWSGRIIGYKLTPLYEVTNKPVFKTLTKIKKIKTKGKRK